MDVWDVETGGPTRKKSTGREMESELDQETIDWEGNAVIPALAVVRLI
jgi:hypothetical protein